jgi:hypothetical protein
MDNLPSQMAILHRYALTNKLKLVKRLGMEDFVKRYRKDTAVVPAEERISTLDLYAIYDLIRRLRRARYDAARFLPKHPFKVYDLTMNCALIRANLHLKTMADELGERLPDDITKAMQAAPAALEALWDEQTGQYYSRDAVSGQLIKEPTIATFMPLYALELPRQRVLHLLELLHDPETFGAPYPVPSTPLNSPWFKQHCYWQGPTWAPTNWLVIQGLRQNAQAKEAEALAASTLDVIAKAGFHEYFSPLDASDAGADTFSWTAALAIDLMKSPEAAKLYL